MMKEVRLMGRTAGWREDGTLPLFWTGSGVLFDIEGESLAFVLQAGDSQFEQWIRVEVDGVTVLRTSLQPGMNRVTVFRGIDPAKRHRVQLFKEVQAMNQDEAAFLILRSIETPGTLFPVEEPKWKLEFIGDSLTSGEGMACEKHFMDWVSCMFSTEGTYAQLLSKALGGEVHILSQSGWGLYSSWDGDRSHVLPPCYPQVCGLLTGEGNAALGAHLPNDFTWQPDAIVVNLGTNDSSALNLAEDQETFRAAFRKAAEDYLETLRRYNPKALILWAYGMCGYALEEDLREAVANYCRRTGDRRALYVSLPQAGAEEMGSRQHPGARSNALCAQVLLKVLKEYGME